jgi:hypothetical protein
MGNELSWIQAVNGVETLYTARLWLETSFRRNGGSVPTVEVYRGADQVEAYLIQHWLAEHEIEAHVVGAHTQGLPSLVPPGRPLGLSLRVRAEEAQRATELIDTFAKAGEGLDPSPWTCPGCTEDNGPAFDSCWKCQRERPT